MKSIARNWYWLLLVFLLGAWCCRGMQVAIWQQMAQPPAGTAQPRAVNAPPQVQPQAASPTCRTAEPPTAAPYLSVAHADAVKYGVNPLVFDWQIWFESTYRLDETSPAGAQGIAQFMPKTAQEYGIDPWNPRQALDAAARDDAGHLKQFAPQAQQLVAHYGGNEARYDYGLALAAYNAGPGETTTAWNHAYGWGTVWPERGPWAWLNLLGGETQRYIPKILGCSL